MAKKEQRWVIFLLVFIFILIIVLSIPYYQKPQLISEIIKNYPSLSELNCEHAFIYIEEHQIPQKLLNDNILACDSISFVDDSIQFRKIQKLTDKVLFLTQVHQLSLFATSVTTLYIGSEAHVIGEYYIWLIYGWYRIKTEVLGVS